MTYVPSDARRAKATAKQWNWTFSYPNDAVQSFNEVWVEVNQPVEFLLESTDVLHAFFLPSMRVKRDVVPGRYQSVWFTPTELGEYHLFCAEYCGLDHSKMYAKLHVVTAEEYAKRPWDVWEDATPEQAADSGKRLYSQLCASCHSTDGSPMTGPSWQGLFVKSGDEVVGGERRVLLPNNEETTITVDFDYIAESIENPTAKRAVGFEQNAMTAFDLDERRVKGLVEYMKTLAQ